MLSNVAVLLRVLTLNIDNRYTEGIPFYYYIITLVSATSYFYVFLVSMVWFVFHCSLRTDLVPAMVALSLGISSEIGTLKLLYMFIHIDKIRKLVDQYLDCDSATTLGSRFSQNMLKTLREVKKRTIIYWLVLIGNGVLYLLKPVIFPSKLLPMDDYAIYGLEPPLERPYYEITFLLICFAIFFICYVPACVSAYFIVIAGYTEAQMLALSEEMIYLWPDAVAQAKLDDSEYIVKTNIEMVNEAMNPKADKVFEADDGGNGDVIHKIINKRLKDIIKRHSVILNLCIVVEDVFRGAIAMGFIILILGLTSELLGGLENTYVQMPFAYMQVAMDCFVGQRVMDASVAFERAIYECRWENFDKANMRMVLVMLRNAQKTMTLSAGGMSTLSLSCLMTVTRAIYSAYTTLRSVMK